MGAVLDLGAATAGLVQLLREAGLRVTDDPRNAHPPCVYVEPETLTPHSYCASTASWRVLVIAPGAGADAIRALNDPLAQVMRELAGMPTGRLVSWTSPHAGEQLAAWELTYTETVTWEARP